MKKLSLFLLILVLLLGVSSTALAEEGLELTDPGYYAKFQGQGGSLNVYNWGEYISDGSDDSVNVNREFEAVTGIEIRYTNFATNEELYAKLRSGAANYDIIIPSDYMISRLIREDMLEPINFENIPNFEWIDPAFKNMMFDPTNEYSVPYTWGTVGIIYNTTMVDESDDVESWDILWDAKYLGEILMFNNSRDAMAISLKRLGYSMNPDSAEQLQEATEELKNQKPLVQAYVMDEIFDKMVGGEAALAPYYAGDAITMIADNEDLAFAHPREGVNRFVDGICIPKGAKNKEAAEAYINFLCEPVIAAANAEYIGYSSPNLGALELLDPEISQNPIAYPDDEVIEKTEFFLALPVELNNEMDRLWTELLSSDDQYSKWLVPFLMAGAIVASIVINILRSYYRRHDRM